MGSMQKLGIVTASLAVIAMAGCFPPGLGGAELAAWDVRTCELPTGGGCGPYAEFIFFTNGTFVGEAILGNPLSGTWSDRGNGRITMSWRVPGILGTASADLQLSGGSALNTATTLSGTQTAIVFGVSQTLPTDGIRVRP